eukprot:gb/GFBE01016885.1/.p1 GENE.gb/GFBE01016885.1/~~gb/GFBE01016885.1/.p1  ORF type:complete len:253 (+),score=44.45 gb/GFBE01016885.1/:1-759(+)
MAGVSAVTLPSGEWTGWWECLGSRTESPAILNFHEGTVSGSGEDPFGPFEINGEFECKIDSAGSSMMSAFWIKQYKHQHAVRYETQTVNANSDTGQIVIRGSWQLHPPRSWEGAHGTFELRSAGSIEELPEEAARALKCLASSPSSKTSAQEAQTTMHLAEAAMVGRIVEQMKELQEVRMQLQNMRKTSLEASAFEAAAPEMGQALCIICNSHSRSSALVGCGHKALCHFCARSAFLSKVPCPTCQLQEGDS